MGTLRGFPLRRAFIAVGLMAALWVARPARAQDSLAIDTQRCPLFDGKRAQALAASLGATGAPWTDFTARVECEAESVRFVLRKAGGTSLEQALFFDPTSVVDRERWLADVLIANTMEGWGIPPPQPAHTPAPAPPSGGDQFVQPAPTFSQALGPAFIGLRASVLWFNLRNPNRGTNVGLRLGRQQWESLAPYIGIAYTIGDTEPQGADLNLRILHLGAGVLWRRPLIGNLSFEVELGMSAVRGSLTRQQPGQLTNDEQLKGWSAAAELNPMLAWRFSSARMVVGASSGWIFGLPVSNLAGAEQVSVNGPWLGFLVHIGSVPN